MGKDGKQLLMINFQGLLVIQTQQKNVQFYLVPYFVEITKNYKSFNFSTTFGCFKSGFIFI